jgi:CheY-like chemotaxis protein
MTITGSSNRKVAIFDDDEDIVSICSYILEEQGWTVHAFTDCNDIVNRITYIQPSVILMDNWIPDEGGILATQQLKASAQTRHIPVIYFSANSDIETLAATAGADSYLAKPFDLDDLTLAINTAMAIS